MAWVATNGNGKEFLFEKKPYRSGRGEYGYWNPTYSGIGGCVLIPHGSIKKLIGRELSWSDEPVELKLKGVVAATPQIGNLIVNPKG